MFALRCGDDGDEADDFFGGGFNFDVSVLADAFVGQIEARHHFVASDDGGRDCFGQLAVGIKRAVRPIINCRLPIAGRDVNIRAMSFDRSAENLVGEKDDRLFLGSFCQSNLVQFRDGGFLALLRQGMLSQFGSDGIHAMDGGGLGLRSKIEVQDWFGLLLIGMGLLIVGGGAGVLIAGRGAGLLIAGGGAGLFIAGHGAALFIAGRGAGLLICGCACRYLFDHSFFLRFRVRA